jgi:hypothetical protein
MALAAVPPSPRNEVAIAQLEGFLEAGLQRNQINTTFRWSSMNKL